MKKILVKLAIVAVLVFAVTPMVLADTVDYTGFDGKSINFTYGNPVTKTGGIAAEIYLTWNGTPTWSYCVDLDNYIGDSNATAYYGGVGAPITEADFKDAAWMIEKNWSLNLNSVQRAALQAAIWEVRYDSLFTLGNNSNILGFDTYYTAYMAAVSDTSGYNAFAPSQYVYLDLAAIGAAADTVQDQITRVPEPTTFLLLGFGLVGLAGLRKKLF